MTHKEARQASKGQPIPVRIEYWCTANEPADKAADIAGKLIDTFSEVAYDDLTGYERRVWDAITTGGYSK